MQIVAAFAAGADRGEPQFSVDVRRPHWTAARNWAAPDRRNGQKSPPSIRIAIVIPPAFTLTRRKPALATTGAASRQEFAATRIRAPLILTLQVTSCNCTHLAWICRSSAFVIDRALTVVQTVALAQEDNKPPKGFVALFNGRDFEDWTCGLTKSPSELAAMSPEERAKMKDALHEHWHVDNGELVSDGKDPYLATTQRLRRFRDVGRLEDRQGRRQRHLSARRAASANLGPGRSKAKKHGADKGSGGSVEQQDARAISARSGRQTDRRVEPDVYSHGRAVRHREAQRQESRRQCDYGELLRSQGSDSCAGPDLSANARLGNAIPQCVCPRNSGRRSQ